MNYVRFFTRLSLARKPSATRVLTAILQESPPTMISMSTGMPNADLFPIVEGTFKLRDGSSFSLKGEEMKRALQYSTTPGFPELLNWLRTLQQDIHNPPKLEASDDSRTEIVVTIGSQDGLSKILEATVSKGSNILMESPAYPGILAIVKPLKANIISLETDQHGLNPAQLRSVMSQWPASEKLNPESDIPRLLYVIPNGGNPTGCGLTLERKKEIYQIAREYDLLILEDDPYFFLQFSKPYIPSFLSLDEDGRVVRFDSFSKVMSAGLRFGFVTGPKAFTEKLVLHMQCSVMHNSSLTQLIILRTLEMWGLSGFKEHALKVADFYKKRRDQCISAARKHLTGLAEWKTPSGGMFYWMKLNGVDDTHKLIMEKARKKGVLFVPGSSFSPNDEPSAYIRVSYSQTSPEEMDKKSSKHVLIIGRYGSCPPPSKLPKNPEG